MAVKAEILDDFTPIRRKPINEIAQIGGNVVRVGQQSCKGEIACIVERMIGNLVKDGFQITDGQ